MKPTFPNSAAHYFESNHTATCRRDGDIWAFRGHPAEVMTRVGWKGGSHRQERASRWGAEGTGMLQSDAETGTKQCIDLKGSSEVDAASLALPGSSGRHREVDGHLLCMQGLNCLESGPSGMYPLDQMRMRVGERI